MLRLFNTLTRRKEEFVPLNPPNVGFYSCGPTVYNFIHIGNLRTFMFEDILRRYLKFKGYKVKQLMNITDIDDKTIKGSIEAGVPLNEYTKQYIEAFFEDIKMLSIEPVEIYPRATEHIEDMAKLVKILLDKGYAYESEGSIYFDVAKFENYGALSGIKPESSQLQARIDHDEYEKQDVRDFALWKGPREGEPSWDTEVGPGRPGWHIECSAMSMKYLGETFDIHTGGVDNMFPHHENEIAQSTAATGKPLARYWLHSGYLLMDKAKMAKSLGNTFTLREIVKSGYSPRQIRYFMISAHYRKQLSFSLDALDQAAASLARLDEFVRNLRSATCSDSGDTRVEDAAANCEREFEEAMDDDLNISKGLGALFTFVRAANEGINEGHLSESGRKRVEGLLKRINSVIGVIELAEGDDTPDDIRELVEKRMQARERGDWAAADQIRDELKAKGIVIEDTKDGFRIKHI
ncbi:MAG: cysteine--tRNA ligase [Candidatus Coatesbacteria bacterium]|nr:cysteine--tRNA ligase [Candidatus Coatesbacteria bacterium]